MESSEDQMRPRRVRGRIMTREGEYLKKVLGVGGISDHEGVVDKSFEFRFQGWIVLKIGTEIAHPHS